MLIESTECTRGRHTIVSGNPSPLIFFTTSEVPTKPAAAGEWSINVIIYTRTERNSFLTIFLGGTIQISYRIAQGSVPFP